MSIRSAGRYGFSRPPMGLVYPATTLAAPGKFDVTGIPPSFRHLWINLLLRGDNAAATDNLYIIFNGDSTVANYRRGFMQVNAGSISTGQDDNLIIAPFPGGTAPANYFGAIDIKIPLYAEGHEKIIYSNFSLRSSAANMLVGQYGVHWENAAPITQITFETDNDPADEIDTGSWAEIWGIY